MINFKEIVFKNFQSYGSHPTTIRLDENKSTLILGKNEDVGNQGESGNGVGKCLGKDTPVMMHDGTIKMVQDIVVGDVLMGDDGSPRNVLSTCTGREELFLVKQNLGMDYVVNRSHILSLKVGSPSKKWGHVKGEIVNIPIDTYLKYPDTTKKAVCGYVGDLIKFGHGREVWQPWLVGLWLADGTTSKPDITFNNNDTDLFNEVEKIRIEEGYNKHVTPSNYRDGCTTISYPGGFLQDLRNIGVLGNKHIPSLYKNASYENRLELLAGILDGDGHKPLNKHIFDIVLKNTPIVDDLVFLARSVGLRVNVVDKFAKCQNFDGDIYKRITITGDIEKIPNRLSRKKAQPKPSTAKPRNLGVTGIKLESIGEGDYYGFEIDGNKLFCLGDMTVTHNTTLANALTFALYGKGVDKMKTDEFVNLRNGKKLEVTLTFEKDGTEHTIRRFRKPNKLFFEIDGEDVTRDSMKNTEEDILKVVDIPYEIFIRSVFMSPHIDSFLAMTPAEQRNYIEQVLSLDLLANRAEALKNVIKKEAADDVKMLDRDIENANTTNKKVYSQIESTKEKINDFELKREQAITRFKEELSSLPEVNDSMLEKIGQMENYRRQRDECEEISQTYQIEVHKATVVLDRHRDVVDRYIDLVEKEASHEEKTKEKTKTIKKELASLPSLEDLEKFIVYHEVTRDITRLEEKNNKQNQAFRDYLEGVKTKEDKLKSDIRDLEKGTCPYCEQEHFDQSKVDRLKEELIRLMDEMKDEAQSANDADALINSQISVKEGEIVDLKIPEGTDIPENPESLINKRVDLKARLDDIESENPYTPMIVDIEKEYGDDEAIASRLEELEEEVQEQQKGLDRTKQMEKDFTTSIQSIIDEVGFSSKEEAEKAEDKKSSISDKIDEEKQATNPYRDMIDEYREMLVDDEELKEAKTEAEKTLTHVNYLIKLLTDPKSFIRKNIVDRYIPYVNKKMNEYSDELGLPHTIEIMSDMTVDMEYMGKPVSYFMLSRGERLRANVAASLAFRDLMSMLGRNSNLLFVDELLDGSADTYGMNAIFKMISQRSNSVFIVSHREEFKDSVDRHMIVTKRNGFSEIELGDCS